MELKCQNSHDFALWAPIFKMYSYFWIGFKLEKKNLRSITFSASLWSVLSILSSEKRPTARLVLSSSVRLKKILCNLNCGCLIYIVQQLNKYLRNKINLTSAVCFCVERFLYIEAQLQFGMRWTENHRILF